MLNVSDMSQFAIKVDSHEQLLSALDFETTISHPDLPRKHEERYGTVKSVSITCHSTEYPGPGPLSDHLLGAMMVDPL